MSILVAAGASNGLSASSNLSNPVSCTKLIWTKHASPPSAYNPLMTTRDGGVTAYNELFGGDGAGVLAVHSAGSLGDLSPNPAWTNWNCFAMTANAAGAGSLIAYYQDNAGGGFVSTSATGASFTVSDDQIAARGTVNVSMTMAFYMEWNIPLTLGQLNAQFLSATPIVALGNVSRYEILANAATAGHDSSGNGFDMTVVGSVADGIGLPTFPSGTSTGLLTLGCG